MITNSIIQELLDIRYAVDDAALECVYDTLELYECDITTVNNLDWVIIIKFTDKSKDLIGELRIDRVKKSFTVVGYCGGFMLPAEGDWKVVLEYLNHLTNPS
tara:strand:- start:1238 stop:1543 length:306 start_codon:yes stop_codon:yes gene_type:complete